MAESKLWAISPRYTAVKLESLPLKTGKFDFAWVYTSHFQNLRMCHSSPFFSLQKTWANPILYYTAIFARWLALLGWVLPCWHKTDKISTERTALNNKRLFTVITCFNFYSSSGGRYRMSKYNWMPNCNYLPEVHKMKIGWTIMDWKYWFLRKIIFLLNSILCNFWSDKIEMSGS